MPDVTNLRVNKRSQRGFTIIELLIVIVIIAVLSAISAVIYSGIRSRAAYASAESGASQLGTELALYNAENGDYPTSAEFNPDGGCVSETDFCYEPFGEIDYDPDPPTPSDYCLSVNKLVILCEGETPTPITESICPVGFVKVPGSDNYGTDDFCVMRYEAKNVDGSAKTKSSGLPWVSINQANATIKANDACTGCQLMTEAQWMTIAENVISVGSNWSGGSIGSGHLFRGNISHFKLSADDIGSEPGSVERRYLTLNTGDDIWDLSGNISEWTQGNLMSNNQPGYSFDPANSGDQDLYKKQWNSVDIWTHNGFTFPSTSRPPAIANNWQSYQGIGVLYSNYNDPKTPAISLGYLRGGTCISSIYAGIYGLEFSGASGLYNGFRVTKPLS